MVRCENDGDELAPRIAALRERLQGGDSGSLATAEAMAELADLLAERRLRRLAVDDLAGASEDLAELIVRLDAMLAHCAPQSGLHALLAWRTGFAYAERWEMHGDPAHRDEAIQRLTGALTTASPAVLPDLHVALVRLHWARADDEEPGAGQFAALDAAIGHARAGLVALPWTTADEPGAAAPGTGTELRLLLGLVLAERFTAARTVLNPAAASSVAAARAFRDEAIAVLDAVLGGFSAEEPARPMVAGALGCALYDRHTDTQSAAALDPDDLHRAIDLLLAAVTAEPEHREVVCLVFALADRLGDRDDLADLDRLITWGQWLLARAEPADPGSNYVRELIASALLNRADAYPQTRAADLDTAIRHLETALAATPANDPDRADLLTSLAHVCWRRLGGDASRYDQVDQMTAYAEQAWTLLPPSADDRVLVGLYLASGIHEQLLRPSASFDVSAATRAIDVLTQVEPLLASDPEPHLTAVVILGHFLVSRGQATGTIADVVAAQPWLLEAARKLPVGDPAWSEITQTLAVAMSTLAALGMNPQHLDQAVDLLAIASGGPHPDPARAALTRGTLGMLLVQRAGFIASERDLDDGIANLVASHEMTPAGHAYRAGTAVNLAGALLTRFLERGQIEDVDAARFYLAIAETQTGPARDELRSLMADADAVITGNRGLLAMIEGMGGEVAAFDVAVSNLQSALDSLPAGHPHISRLGSDLGMALALRGISDAGRPTDLKEAALHLGAAVAAMEGTHMMRPVTLLRTAGVLGVAAIVARDQQRLRLAIGYLTSALGGLDPRFGGRFRFTGLLGASALALYRLSGETADLEGAIGWLEESRRDLSNHPVHPQQASCLINLAQAYRARGAYGPAREAGLLALHSRARDLLLQSGTARSIRHARLAAEEAAHVACWCLEDGSPSAAVEALELGRGLILHASTTIAELPDLLVESGHEELASEWRDRAVTREDTPWEADIPGAEHLLGLLSGNTGLDVPDDMRARALVALTGSTAEQRLLSPPSAVELADALTETGSDAIVYLLGSSSGGGPGRAVIVPASDLTAAAVPMELPLPSMDNRADDMLQAYAAVYTELVGGPPPLRSVPGQDEQAEAYRRAVARWREALADLCVWAWPAAMKPVLDLARTWDLGRPPRLVLIPAGALSLVPWHAATWRPVDAGPVRYAVQDVTLSYAASGRQLREAAGRRSLPLNSRPVVVGDPTETLPGALLEAQAILNRCYPGGHYLGPGGPGWIQPGGPGTPSEVLRQLPTASQAGASMLHLGCHGIVAGATPGRSHLLLAGRQELRVDAILKQAIGRPPGSAGGLVSLAACSSDLALGDYDEALTPATAFMAAGAVTVVAARWQIPDDATSVLMFMFHYLMTRHAHAPRDALRGAQLWMLDPNRVVPDEMPPELAGRTMRSAVSDLTAWAAVVHQGR